MKLKKTTTSLLIMSLLSTFALAYVPLTATALDTITITWLSLWTEVHEKAYWDAVLAKYNSEGHTTTIGGTTYLVNVRQDNVEFDALYDTIMLKHAAGEDPDILHMHSMWVPGFANWQTKILAVPPSDVQEYVRANWLAGGVAGNTYKSIVWGYPTEFDSWTLVYNRVVIQNKISELGSTSADGIFLQGVLDKLEADTPLHWALDETNEFVRAAKLLTKWNTTVSPPIQTQWGFVPFVEGMPEEQRYQFMTLFYSNGGQYPYLDLEVPEALFDSTPGYQVMDFYRRLGYVIDLEPTVEGVQGVYDPLHLPDYWWSAWADETIAMIVLPTWMSYVRDAMGANFGNLGISPIPIGPSGTASKSLTFTWQLAVTQRAVDGGRAAAAWDFLRWVSEAKTTAGSVLPADSPVGKVPRADGVSVIGDYMIYDMIAPSKTDDCTKGRLYDANAPGGVGDLITNSFWYSGFFKFRDSPWGAPDIAIIKGEQVQYEIGLLYESVILGGADATTAVNNAAAAVDAVLPMAGDINLDGPVDVGDAVPYVQDFWATPTDLNWNRGRSDIIEDIDQRVNLADGLVIVRNWGRVGDP